MERRGVAGRRGGAPAVITLSIRPQDGPHQPAGLMFDRIIRKLSGPVITGAHLTTLPFAPCCRYWHTQAYTNRQVICSGAAVRDAGLMEW